MNWKKSIRSHFWRLRPWTKLKQREELIERLKKKVVVQRALITSQQAALDRKRRALAELQTSYDHLLEEFQRQRCTKIKHANKDAAKKAGNRLFNQTSHVMEPYECYVCPRNPETQEKWWHIRHALKAERGKNGQIGIYREAPGN